MSRRVDLLIFDWDGTLADSAAQIVQSMQSAIDALKLPPRTDHEIRDLIGLGMHDVLTRLFPELHQGDLMALLAQYREAYLSKLPPEAPLFAGALEALQRLHADGYRLAVATGKSRAGLRRSLAHHTDVRDLLVSIKEDNPEFSVQLVIKEALARVPSLAVFPGSRDEVVAVVRELAYALDYATSQPAALHVMEEAR